MIFFGADVANAFENQEVIPEVEEQVVDPIRQQQITEYENRIAALRAIHLYQTADLIQRRLDKLLQEMRDPLEG